MPGVRARSATAPTSAGGDADLASIGVLVADQSRCRMLFALADGRSLPASRLAAEAGISAATASNHLRKLTDAGLVKFAASGRYRNYRLASPDVANLIEALERLAPTIAVRSLAQSQRARAWREARTCYDHLAGRLGVDLMSALVERGYLDLTGEPASGDGPAPNSVAPNYMITKSGMQFLDQFGLRLPTSRRPVRYHLDSTESSPHLSGVLGRSLLARLLELEWVQRSSSSRTLRVTQRGRQGLHEQLGMPLNEST